MGTSKKNTETITSNQSLVKRTTKHNHKLSTEDIKEIMLYYYLDNTRATREEILNKYNISESYYYRLIKDKKNIELINKDITESKQLFSKKTEIIINKILNKVNNKVDTEDASIKDLITSMGILYDKNRLEQNLSTSNNSIQINLKIER